MVYPPPPMLLLMAYSFGHITEEELIYYIELRKKRIEEETEHE